QEVIQFTESLINYLFPVVRDEQQFLKDHLSVQSSLKKSLIGIISPLNKNHDIDVLDVADTFFSSLHDITQQLLKDADLILEFDPAAYSLEEVMLTYPGFYAIIVHRLAHELY